MTTEQIAPVAAEIVTVCGSMRFHELMLTVAADDTRAGRIVLMPHAVVQPDDQGSDLKAMLDRLHRQKIDLSARIVVVSDESGYYGRSTAGEIEYARAQGKPVTFVRVYNGQSESTDVVDMDWCRSCEFTAGCNYYLDAGVHHCASCAAVLVARPVVDQVPCFFRCGYLATSEADLDEHEATCENAGPEPEGMPAPRPIGSLIRGGDR